jgi:hypothetical protein
MDGVGDYTRRLAVQLSSQGHKCHLLAVADSRINKATAANLGDADHIVPSLRLPATDSWRERVRQAKVFCAHASPDWISWQMVPYGYDSRGLCFGLGKRFEEISGGHPNQIMFHEIWIGEAMKSSVKNKLVGKFQQHIIQDLLQRLRPRIVHTHTPLYQHLLGNLRYPATILPLFGNIPIASRMDPDWLRQKWPEGWDEYNMADRKAWWIFVMFGSIHPEWDPEDFWQRASEAAKRAGKKCALISIGRPGPIGERMLKQLYKRESNSWRFLTLGQQSEEDISQCLLAADFGVSAAPPEYLHKSGTAVAMIEHGLQVIATRPMYQYRNCPPETLSDGMKNVRVDFNLETLKKTKTESLLPTVAAQFIDDLSHS